MSNRIIVVEDDPSTRKLIEFVLGKESFEVFSYANGKEALEALGQVNPDVVITDLMMPEMDGIELTKQLRARSEYNKVPILVLTAKDQMVNKYEAFTVGADDYINKPFDPLELIFRVRSYLRLTSDTTAASAPEQLEVGRVRLERGMYCAYVEGVEVQLTKLETAVLEYLMQHKDQVISAEQISTEVLGHMSGSGARSVDAAQAHIRNLRQKLEKDPTNPTILVTVGRKGYRFNG
ncbi:MAG TPA: response regulator transcription factor [Oscillatoriaceae cyanobacterium]